MPRKKPIPDDCMPKCATCAFIQTEPGQDAGYCRRYPPVVVSSEEGEYSAFPVVEMIDFCGEYRRRTN
jgi:hypothetical protein